jgi:NAD(P)-dependent dehydrogenase (short-subunit alcohol dehydrogenase family)
MTYPMNRREVLLRAGAAAALTAMGAKRVFADIPGVPQSPFGASSTAEEVTAGIDLTDKTVFITGINSGLGYEAMRVLAMRGAHVLGAARTKEKAEKACQSVDGRTTPFVCELSDFQGVAECAKQAKATGKPIDILICNAGISAVPELKQIHGIEWHFAVNHLGHFVLANHLLDSLKAADQGRVVVLSSTVNKDAHENGIEFDNLSGQRDYDPHRAYGQSKLANGLFSRQLSKHLEATRVTSNSVHPGVINTNINRNYGPFMTFVADYIGPFLMKTMPEGAATSCYVATYPDLANTSGYYFEDCQAVAPGGHMEDDAMAEKLWDVSVELTKQYLPATSA